MTLPNMCGVDPPPMKHPAPCANPPLPRLHPCRRFRPATAANLYATAQER